MSDTARPNKRLVTRLLILVVAMFAFGFALVPLYDVMCKALGINGKTGIGKAVDSGLEALFSAQVDPAGVALPRVDGFEFDNGDGDGGVVPGPGLQASTVLDYGTAGKHVGTVTVKLHDGSALCDNILGNVLTSDNRISLTVTTSPAGNVFRPGDPQTGIVNLRVRVKNISDPSVARGVVLFKGANVLS